MTVIGRTQSRMLAWLVPGDAAATCINLATAIDAGQVDAIDRIRAVWWLRRLTDECGPDDAAHRLRDRLDPTGQIPPAPNIRALRFWVDAHARNLPRGSLSSLGRLAGLHRSDLGRFRAGGPLTTEKVERVAAALIASGAWNHSRNHDHNRR